MTKVTYYMYSCDTCCMIREMIEMNGRDCAKCQKSRQRDMDGIMEMFNKNKTKCNSDLLLQRSKNCAIGWKRCRK